MEKDILLFLKPTLQMESQALAYKEEHFQYGEQELHGGAMLGDMQYKEWLRLTLANADESTVHSNWVLASTFFVMRKSDNELIGMVDIRHYLNEFLSSFGGHIGYGVRPSQRHNGYATKILQMALDYAKEIGLNRVMLACYKHNEASRKVILHCGGSLEREYVDNNKIVEIYWITLCI